MLLAERYCRNANAFSENELKIIQEKSICVIGCGGLGGNVIQSLARFGIGKLTLVDGDVFATNNLNRQLFSNTTNLGRKKVEVTKEELFKVNPELDVQVVPEMLDLNNGTEIVANHHLVIDCLDNIETRFLLADICTKLNIPLVHGAIGGFFGQVANLFPGDNMIERIYPDRKISDSGLEKLMGTPSFLPQVIGGIQSSEALKLLAGRQDVLQNSILFIDLLKNTMEEITMR